MEDLDFILNAANEKAAEISDMNRKVWSYAEPGFSEFKSSEALMKVLEDEGFEVEKGIADIPTAFVARFGNGHPIIGITAEYDALPGLSQEAGNAEKTAIEGQAYGHGCGHCALGAGSVGAAVLVKEWLKETGAQGTIELYGTPAEEAGFAKTFMARAHCFDHLDMAFSWHPADMNAAAAGRCVANLIARFEFKGISAHAAASPEAGRSALDACELMNVGVNYLREHVIDKARIHYAYLDAGGQAPNVVQSHATLLYYMRAPKMAQSRDIFRRISNIAKGAALMTETEVNIRIVGGLSDVIPNATAQQLLSDAFKATGGPSFEESDYEIARKFIDALPIDQKQATIQRGAMTNGVTPEEFAKHPLITKVYGFSMDQMNNVFTASSDVGDLSYVVPTGQVMASTCTPNTAMHTWQHTAMVGTGIGDKGAIAAARAIALACTKVYRDPSLCEEARKSLNAETGGVYECPLPEELKPGEGIDF